MAYASAETVVKDAESARNAASRIRRRGSGGEAEEAEMEARLDDVEERLEQMEEDARKTAERH
jgi:phage shock protein A